MVARSTSCNRAIWDRASIALSITSELVTVLSVRRTNYGYQRFWEGRTYLQKMTACWIDAYIQVQAHCEAIMVYKTSGIFIRQAISVMMWQLLPSVTCTAARRLKVHIGHSCLQSQEHL